MPAFGLRRRARITAATTALCLGGLVPPVLPSAAGAPPTPSNVASVAVQGEGHRDRPPRRTLDPEPEDVGARAIGSSVSPPPGAECPTGTVKLRTAYADSFEGRFNRPTVNFGWTFNRSDSAAAGTYTLLSERTWTGRDDEYSELALESPVTLGTGRTYLSFSARGTYAAGSAVVYANADSWGLSRVASPTAFSRFRLDLTDTVSVAGDSSVTLRFANVPAFAENRSPQTFEIDDVSIYQCSATASKATGDFNGDGRADVVAVDSVGTLWLWRGTGRGTLEPDPIRAGTGWGSMTWIAAVGDLDGDGRADLMARDTAGSLWSYSGDGIRSFSSRSLIGTWWHTMASIVPMPDMTGDGVPELLGLTTSGDLYRYTLRPGPRITDKTLIGIQFYEFSRLTSTGDYNGDGTPDVLGIKKADDTMWAYWTRPGGTLQPRGTFLGNGWTMKHVSSPGDFDGNGFRDVLALNRYDNLVVYYVAAGRWAGTAVAGTGWRYRLIG